MRTASKRSRKPPCYAHLPMSQPLERVLAGLMSPGERAFSWKAGAGQCHKETLGFLGTPLLTILIPLHSFRGCVCRSLTRTSLGALSSLVIGLYHSCCGLLGPLKICSFCLKADICWVHLACGTAYWLIPTSPCSVGPDGSCVLSVKIGSRISTYQKIGANLKPKFQTA